MARLTHSDRIKMEALLNAGHSVKEIANQLHVHQATIYREYNRGKYMHRNSDYTEEERYSSDLGQQAHDWYITGKGRPLKIKNDIKYIEKLEKKILDEKYSPEAALNALQQEGEQMCISVRNSIANNIAIAKHGASKEEIMEAAKKASLHDFIMTLPNGYDTEVGELGDTLSGGEKQRIGIARAFLHDAPMILMDEPTSNLDSLNEGIILKSLKESAEKKTVVLVSHRVSTMNVADVVYEMENGRIS